MPWARNWRCLSESSQRNLSLRLFSVPWSQTPADLILILMCFPIIGSISCNHLSHVLSIMSEHFDWTEWWMNIGKILILSDLKQRDTSVILIASCRGHDSSSYIQAGCPLETWSPTVLCRTQGDSCDFLALQPVNWYEHVLYIHQQLSWFVKVSWHTTSGICWTFSSSIPYSTMYIFSTDRCGCNVCSVTSCFWSPLLSAAL